MVRNSQRHTCILGVNHKTATIDKRDRLVFTPDEQSDALKLFSGLPHVLEVILISTCNRTEVYFIVDQEPSTCYESLLHTWFTFKNVLNEALDECFFFHAHEAAIEHLFNVSCSLDSLIVGEVQILGQIKKAYHFAKDRNTTNLYLNRLFQEAIKLGKKARTETEISKGAVSISFAAVELLRKKVPTLTSSRVGIVGTGKMGELSVKNLIDSGVNSIHFINRTLSKAEEKAKHYGGHAWALEDLPNAINKLDIIISCASAGEPIINVSDMTALSPNHMLVIVDIASPRNVSPDVDLLENVTVFDIDHLNLIVGENIKKRSGAITEVEAIITQELKEFYAWYSAQEVVPVLKAMRQHVQNIAQTELQPLQSRLNAKEFDAVKQAFHTMTNKILHTPSQALKEMCYDGRSESASEYAKELFELEF